MVDRTQSLEGDGTVGDILVKIRGRHYLIPAEAIGRQQSNQDEREFE